MKEEVKLIPMHDAYDWFQHNSTERLLRTVSEMLEEEGLDNTEIGIEFEEARKALSLVGYAMTSNPAVSISATKRMEINRLGGL